MPDENTPVPDAHEENAEKLARGSRLQVVTATDGVTLEPSHVYVIPPNSDVAVMNGLGSKPSGSTWNMRPAAKDDWTALAHTPG